MAYRNQNYMTNRKIKEEVDKNQKGYEAPVEEEEEITITATFNIFYSNDIPAEGASVKIGSTTHIAEDDGIVIFTNLPNEEATATITLNDETKTETIVANTKNQTFNVIFEQGATIGSTEPMIEEEGEL